MKSGTKIIAALAIVLALYAVSYIYVYHNESPRVRAEVVDAFCHRPLNTLNRCDAARQIDIFYAPLLAIEDNVLGLDTPALDQVYKIMLAGK